MGSRYKVVLRRSGRPEKSSHETLEAALDALEHETRGVANRHQPRVERALGRDYEPDAQVVARAELRGPRGLAAGLDVRGDGSAEAYTGRITKRLVQQHDREDAWSALRRVVTADAG